MINSSIVFRTLTAEEAGIIIGGSGLTPQFGLISTGDTTEGKIMNANGGNKDVTVYSAKNSSSTNNSNEAPYQDIALPPY